MKQCPNCGAWNTDEARFCSSCGTQLPDAGPQPGYQNTNPGGQAPGPNRQDPGYSYYSERPPIQARSVALCIVLTLITCGLYGLYWMYCLNEDLNRLAGNQDYTNGGMVIVFNIITCSIYGIYWAYKMGQITSSLTGDSFYPIVFLLLALFGFQFINYALMQDAVNRCV